MILALGEASSYFQPCPHLRTPEDNIRCHCGCVKMLSPLSTSSHLSVFGLSNFTFTFRFHALEKEMATHSSVLAWGIPGTGEPGGLPSMGSHRVGHD